MQAFIKKHILTVIILGATLILAGVGIFTAIRLYQLRNQAVAPNVPSSKPAAKDINPDLPDPQCTLTFELGVIPPTATPTATPTSSSSGIPTSSPTESPTGSPTATPTSTPTPTPIGCNETCTANSDCTGNMTCTGGRCRNPNCSNESDCTCTTPGISTNKTTEPSLPDAGISTPTIIGGFAGILLLIGAFLLAL